MIVVRNLKIQRAGAVICSVPELEVPEGARLWIHGRNGTGKSTLMRVLAGLEPAPPKACTLALKKIDIAYLSQKPYLFKGGLKHNLAYGLKARGIRGQECNQRVAEAIRHYDLTELDGQDLATASGGERQRIALARALILRPRLLLLDEPFAELDEGQAERIQAVLDQASGLTLVISAPHPPPAGWTGQTYEMKRDTGDGR